jgi:hypothetical protein
MGVMRLPTRGASPTTAQSAFLVTYQNGMMARALKRAMLFTGYIDESDTHDPAPAMVMSAMLSTVGRWERCERALKRIQRNFGFTLFHATDFRSLHGEFARWSEIKCRDILMEFGKLGETHLTECFTVSMSYEIYKTQFLAKRPSKMHRISQYGICFMGALDGLIRKVMAQGPQHKLSVVVEAGHENAPDTARLFKERKERLDVAGIDLLCSHSHSHSLVSKKDGPLQQLVDITAHGHTLERRAIKSGDMPHFSERNERDPTHLEPGWTIAEVTPEYIESVIEEYNSGRVAANEEFLRRKQAWLDAKTVSGREP